MLFVNLLYLAATGAIAGPVMLHLLLRQRPQRQTLPTLRFLTAAAPQSYAMHKFKNMLLLFSRMLLVLLIVLAFARPFFNAADAPEGQETAGIGMVLVMDRSCSMQAGDTWEIARTRARNALKSVPEDSPVALIVFDRVSRLAVPETRDAGRVLSELQVIEPGFAATDLGAALRAGAEAGNQLNAHRARVVIISDYQRSAMQQALAPVHVRPGVDFETIQVGAEPSVNVAIASAQTIPAELADKQSVLLEIRRFGKGDAEGAVELFEDGKSLGDQPLNWAEGAQTFVEFVVDKPTANDVILRAEVHVTDSHPADNDSNVLLEVERAIPVLVLQQTGRVKFASSESGLFPVGANRFVKAAVQACGGLVDAAWSSGSGITPETLLRYPVVLALDVDAYGDDAVAAIDAYVESGGALVLFPGNGATSTLQALSGSTVGGWKQLDEQLSEYRLVSSVRHQGPLDLLGSTGESVLGHPKVYRYLNVEPGVENGAATVAQFDNGAPFILERRKGDGLVYAFTVPLEASATDFVLRASFAPFLYELVAHATHETEARRRYLVGDGASATLMRGIDDVQMPNGKTLPAQTVTSFAEPGAYALTSESKATLVSVNIDPMESDLARLNQTEIDGIRDLGISGDVGEGGADELNDADVTMPPDESGKFWRYLLFAALAVFAFESILASRTLR